MSEFNSLVFLTILKSGKENKPCTHQAAVGAVDVQLSSGGRAGTFLEPHELKTKLEIQKKKNFHSRLFLGMFRLFLGHMWVGLVFLVKKT